MTTLKISKRMAKWLSSNLHLTPICRVGNGVLVRDIYADEFGRPMHYILTPDLRVVHINDFGPSLPVPTLEVA